MKTIFILGSWRKEGWSFWMSRIHQQLSEEFLEAIGRIWKSAAVRRIVWIGSCEKNCSKQSENQQLSEDLFEAIWRIWLQYLFSRNYICNVCLTLYFGFLAWQYFATTKVLDVWVSWIQKYFAQIQIQNFAPIISEKNYEKKAHCEVHHEAITTNNIETWRLSQGIINIMQISLPLEKC